jgi:hypothetical protein
MKNITRHTGVVSDIKRLPSSYVGNPRYSFMVDGYRVTTGVDSMHGYSITNYEDKQVKVTIGTHYNRLTLDSISIVLPPCAKVMFNNSKYNYMTSLSAQCAKQDAQDYFIGGTFDVGVYPIENMQTCIGIEYSKSEVTA